MTQKILLVDDEPNVLAGFRRHLRKGYDIEYATGGDMALKVIAEKGPFAVVVSDMQMPEMSGVELLSRIHEVREHTVRIMLTGNADQQTAVNAVNEGRIFRFLNKPCSPEALAAVLDTALEHHRLITAEEELLSKTLSGSVFMLTQVMSMALPEAFGLSQEARTFAKDIAAKLELTTLWQIELSAMLMRLGCVSLDSEVATAYLHGQELNSRQQKQVDSTPELAHKLLSPIPRLQVVGEYIRAMNLPLQEEAPLESRILRVVGDYQRFRSRGTPAKALDELRDEETYDQLVVNALEELIPEASLERDIRVEQLRAGMVLADHIEDMDGRVLVAKGAELHEVMIEKLKHLSSTPTGVSQPIRVYVDESCPAESPEALIA